MKISVPLSTSGIRDAISQVKQYKAELDSRLNLFVKRLAEEGLEVAKIRFASAEYAGTNDVSVSVEQNGHNAKIIASGNAVAFIEFGTGVSHPHYPGSAAAPYPHGSFGKGLGKNKSWIYRGEQGKSGEPVLNRRGVPRSGVFKTSGNPPAMAMWNATETMASRIQAIWLEVMS